MISKKRPGILVTRPKDQAVGTCKALWERGFEPILSPSIEIERLRLPSQLNTRFSAILVTSANAAHAVKDLKYRAPLMAVGEATAMALRLQGIEPAITGNGTARDLATKLDSLVGSGNDPVLYLRGRHSAYDLRRDAQEQGIQLQEAIVYEARATGRIEPMVLRQLATGSVVAALFFSARSLESWQYCVPESHIKQLKQIGLVAMSSNVAERAFEDYWRWIRIAARPTEEAILDCLDGL